MQNDTDKLPIRFTGDFFLWTESSQMVFSWAEDDSGPSAARVRRSSSAKAFVKHPYMGAEGLHIR